MKTVAEIREYHARLAAPDSGISPEFQMITVAETGVMLQALDDLQARWNGADQARAAYQRERDEARQTIETMQLAPETLQKEAATLEARLTPRAQTGDAKPLTRAQLDRARLDDDVNGNVTLDPDEVSALLAERDALQADLATEKARADAAEAARHWLIARFETEAKREGLEVQWTDGGGSECPGGFHRNPYFNRGLLDAARAEAATLRAEAMRARQANEGLAHLNDTLRDTVQRLTAELDDMREWPCETDDCDHVLADVRAHDGSHPRPTSGGFWVCGACWNKMVAERDLANTQAEHFARERDLHATEACRAVEALRAAKASFVDTATVLGRRMRAARKLVDAALSAPASAEWLAARDAATFARGQKDGADNVRASEECEGCDASLLPLSDGSARS